MMMTTSLQALLLAISLLAFCSPAAAQTVPGNSSRSTSAGADCDVTLFPSRGNFGKVRAGETIRRGIHLLNNASAPASITELVLKQGTQNFQIISPKGPVVIPPRDSIEMIVEFTAGLKGRTSGLVVFDDSVGVRDECGLRYLGLLKAQIVKPVIEVTDHDYGNIPVGIQSRTWTMEVRNVSQIEGSTLTVSARRGPNHNSPTAIFDEVGGDAVPRFDLEPGQSRTISFTARPARAIEYRDSIAFTSNAMGGDSIGWMIVRGINADVFAKSYHWGRRRIGGVYGPVNISVNNIGEIPATIVSISMVGDITQFTILNRDALIGKRVGPADSLILQVQFNPTFTGPKLARVIYETDPAQENEVVTGLQAFGTQPQLFTTDYDFGTMALDEPERKSHQPIAFWTPATIEFDSVTITGFEFTTDNSNGMDDFRYQPISLPVPVVMHAGDRYELDAFFAARAPGMRTARLRAITQDGVDTTSNWFGNRASSSVGQPALNLLSGMQVLPNPASGSSLMVRYSASRGPIGLSLADLLGRTLRETLVQEHEGGDGSLVVDIGGIPAGIYYLRLNAGGTVKTTSVTIIR